MDALADRNLLFGLLALQTGMIDQAALVVAFNTWTRDKVRSLAEILLDQGAIDEDDRDALSRMAARHLKRHGDDAGKSLGAVPAARSLRRSLGDLADPDVDATLGLVGVSSPTGTQLDAEATGTYGAPAGDGKRFRILRPLAQGGLGEVFVALDDELHREVALKQILDHHADDPLSRTRFVLEAEITGGLEHPGIVPVYGLGSHGDGRPYYAMRFIRGDSLKEAIAAFHADESLKKDHGKRSLALRKLLRRFVDVCNAIDYAHGRGILHRDIKPANVIVGKHGETLVVDWGLAKAMGHAEPGSPNDERTLMPSSASGSAETLPGSALGTPAYMSPEQSTGDLERLGPRSDVYSLGATLYCILAGQAPFAGTDLGAVLRAVQKGDFPKPRQANPSIDPALESVCLKAMATKPEDRHATARALADDVDRWSADEPVSSYRDPVQVRLARWARRHRTGVAIGAGVLQTAVVVLGVSTVLLGQSRERIDRERSRSEAVNNFLIKDLLSQADPEKNPVGDRMTVRELLDKAATAIEGSPSLKGREDVEGAIRAAIGRTFFSLGLYQPSERHLARAVECQERAAAVVPVAERIATKNRYLWTLYKAHKHDGIKEKLEETLAEATRDLGPEHEETIYAADSLAALYNTRNFKDQAFVIYRRNLEIQTRLHGPEDRLTLVAAGNLATALLNANLTRTDPQSMKFVAEAASIAHSTRADALRAYGPDSPEALRNATYEGQALNILGKYAEAAALLGPLRDRFIRVFGPDNPNTAAALWQIGLAEEGLGHLEAAVPALRKAYEVRRDGLGPNIFMTHEVLRSLIRVKYALGEDDEAAMLIREIIANPTGTLEGEVPTVEVVKSTLAGEGDPVILFKTMLLIQGATMTNREGDWVGLRMWFLQQEIDHRAGRFKGEALETVINQVKFNLIKLESNPRTPKRFIDQARELEAKLIRARPAKAPGSPAQGGP